MKTDLSLAELLALVEIVVKQTVSRCRGVEVLERLDPPIACPDSGDSADD